jgi:drug/metabolite transporter (DMT)-like permease
MIHHNNKKAYLFAGLAVLMWSTVGSAFKLTLKYVDPIQMLLFASFISIIVLLIVLLIQKKLKLLAGQSILDYSKSIIYGFINPFLFYIVLFSAYDLLLTQEAMVLNFTWPVTLTILSLIFLNQRIGWKSFGCILISFIGIVVIGTNGHVFSLKFSNGLGVALALGSTILWSSFWILNMKDQRDEIVKLFLNFTFGFIYILIFCILTGRMIIPPMEAILGSLYIGVFEMGLAYVLWLKALQLSDTTSRISILIFLAPFLSLVFIRLTLGEHILFSTYAGLGLIVLGIVLDKLIYNSKD